MKKRSPTNSVRTFFKNNPEEELTLKDMQIKYDLSYEHARVIARHLCERGELVEVKLGRKNVYRRAA